MYISPARALTPSSERSLHTTRVGWSSRLVARLAIGASLATLGTAAIAAPIATIDRNGSLVSVEAYAPNIVCVTIATDRGQVDAPPGDGPNAKPNAAGWTHQTTNSADVFASAALSLSVDAKPWPKAPSQMERYFAPSLPPVSVTIRKPDGTMLTQMTGWEMAPHTVNGEKTFRVGASFASPADEHY
jgi:alpha-D-xyloside xylohydrolase